MDNPDIPGKKRTANKRVYTVYCHFGRSNQQEYIHQSRIFACTRV